MTSATQITLKAFPDGLPQDADFEFKTIELDEPGPDHLLIEVTHISIDAFIRTTLGSGGLHTQAALGGPVTALGVGKVLKSGSADFSEGDYVAGPTLAQTHALMPAAMFQKIDPGNESPSKFLGVYGMTTGLTAYAGMARLGEVKEGEVVVVSAAAGAVGSVACQIAKHMGGTVIGIAGGAHKCEYLLEDVGCDHAIDYKAGDVGGQLDAITQSGIDVFFDNVGGEILDLVLERLASNARVILCGAISQYDDLSAVTGPSQYLKIAERNSRMLGFTVDHYAAEFPAFIEQLSSWSEAGLHLTEHVEHGIERFPEALRIMFTGGHMGKLLVEV